MKKVLLSILLMLLPMLASADTVVEIDGICYNLVKKLKEAEVTSITNYYPGSVEIPESVTKDGIEYRVTSIGSKAFAECIGLTSVTIGNNVTSIGNSAFYGCRDLTSITIPNSVTSIGENAFHNCSGLTSVTIPNSMTSISNYAFNGCSGLTSVTIPNSVTSIGSEAFWECTVLTSVTIPNSVTEIGGGAFSGCKSLTSVTIPNSVTEIGGGAFSDCKSLTSVTIPNSVTSVGNYAFKGCSGLTSVTIPNSVKSIGEYAFTECSGLTSVHISDLKAWCSINFASSSANPLSYAHHLYLNGVEIKDLVIPSSVTTIGRYAFGGCSGLTSVTIPSSVTSIGSSAFSGCSGLTSVTIPCSVTSIGNGAFSGCSGLTSVTIPNSVTSIGNSAFEYCSGLTSVNIPNSVTSIGGYVFEYCSGLTSVTIPNSVTSIGEQAFANCDELTDVYCLAEKLSKDNSWGYEGLYTHPDAFKDSYPQVMTLHVPAASIEAYRSTEPWSQFKTFVTIEDGDIPTPPEPQIPPKCATPEINYVEGKVSFSCETEGVEYISEVTVADAKKYYDSEFTLSQTYKITVYAVKTGYENSDVATREIIIENGQSSLFGDLNKDGKVDVADHVTLSNIIMNK